MKLSSLLLVLAVSCPLVRADEHALPRATPESQGVSAAGVSEFIHTLDQKIDAVHSVMIVRHGHVIAEGWWGPYAANEPHILYSLSKSFTSTAIGLAQSERRLSVNDPILKFFPELAPKDPSANLKAMRIADLLRMSTGHHDSDIDPFPFATQDDLVKYFLSRPVTDKPGTHFFYNSGATYVLSAIVKKVTGKTVVDYLKPRLFDPLGIANPVWESSGDGVSYGAFGLSLHTEDIAKFGLLYLHKGEWGNRRLIPASWVETATARQTANGSDPTSDWEQGYGYQFWRCRYDFYRGDGAFGQFCIVMPSVDTVVAITSGTRDMGGVMNAIWDKLLPELRPAALPSDEDGDAILQKQLAGLTLPVPKSTGAAPAGIVGKKFVFAANDAGLESLSLASEPNGTTSVHVRFLGTDQVIPVETGTWTKFGYQAVTGPEKPVMGSVHYGRLPAKPFAIDFEYADRLAAAGAWISPDTYELKICQYRTTFTQTIRLKFTGNDVTVTAAQNVGFDKLEAAPIIGHAQ
ncbi:MAG TPA: serine hydrolase [Candidatus Didemnitutus sp.]|nr:serine hydrolase [Candidatus Didemnitutus sp.]